ncbi:MAG: MBL fold metallo-hydrolase [Mediterranea sp.]|jgi:phosphoribosyl 1,2-cyclic phosphodiesterase|nr:MBL fold metallo-hydrolase [Mediterranea sp.]
MKVKFMSLASGSSGNCYYLAYEDYGILIDAGIGIRTITKHLKSAGIPIRSIRGVFVTHDHTDHIKAIGYLGEKLHMPIYATALTHKKINKSYCITEKLHDSVRTIEKETPVQCGPFRITPFEVPHDGVDNVGYFIEINGRFFSFATDLGEITPLVAQYINKANYLILEANYDEEMLGTGPYPAYLKQRISGRNGHLSNLAAANFLAENIREEWLYIWLCHLSKDNNHPELAFKTVEEKLKSKGIVVGKDVQLFALKRNTPSELYLLG